MNRFQFSTFFAILLTGLDEAIAFGPSSQSRCDLKPSTTSCRRRWKNGVYTYSHSSTRMFAEGDDSSSPAAPAAAPPILNGKRVLPYKVLMAGLKGHSNVAGVFALIDSDYKRGYAGWENCQHIAVSEDLDASITELYETHGSESVAHIRAMSFVIPSIGAMESIADDWRLEAVKSGGKINFDPVSAAMEMPYDEDEDEDEDDLEFLEMTAQAMAMGSASMGGSSAATSEETDGVTSPFEMPKSASVTTSADEKIEFNKENVDKVLDEIRPYLINDGGNVSVERVDEETGNVYLLLEGACGSCPSSTVTMQMGIERVLKENFENLGEVLQVEDDDAPTEVSYDMVAVEVKRVSGAITAMGGSVEIVDVNGETGVVQMKFSGAPKVRQGLELAILDVDFVNEVVFVE